MFTIKKTTTLFMLLIASSMGAFAQTEQDVSDKDLKVFSNAFKQVQSVNQQAQQDMVKSVEEEGLKVERYTEIQKAEQDPNQEVDATDEEMEKFKSASEELKKIQVAAQQKMEKKIVEEGLTVPRYQEIAAAIQADPELQEKLQEYMQG